MTVLLGLVLAIAAVFVVVSPILRPKSARPAPGPVFDDPEDDPVEHRKELALAALKEIEFDRETGKLSDTDYQAMLARYTQEAVEALRAADAVAATGARVPGGNGHAPQGPATPTEVDAVEQLIAEARRAGKGKRFCTNCGAELEGSGRFCVECGARV
jgi:hypothetical protein